MEDGFKQEQGLKGVERGLTSWGPVPRQVLFSEVNEWSGDVGVVGDKASVEIGKAKEGLDVLHLFRSRPTGDAIQFDRVHGELSGFNNHSKVFHFVGGEAAFL